MSLLKCVSPLAALLAGALAVGCASSAPPELVQARSAYNRAATGPAAQYAPAQLRVAKDALSGAEDQFTIDGDSQRTRDRSYVAIRKAQLADAQARVAQADISTASTEQQVILTQGQVLSQTQEALKSTQAQLAAEAQANAELERLGAIKQTARGVVLTLSGALLFPTGKSTLVGAKDKLDELADALNRVDPKAKIEIDGYTDATGTTAVNEALSQKRADVVRDYLVQRGVASDRISAKGFGPSNPIATNDTPDGRASNRRVEIVIERSHASSVR